MPYYNTKEAARALKVSEATVRRYVDRGLLRAEHRGLRRFIHIPEKELRRFAHEHDITLELSEVLSESEKERSPERPGDR